jgi:hypothetical protein
MTLAVLVKRRLARHLNATFDNEAIARRAQ